MALQFQQNKDEIYMFDLKTKYYDIHKIWKVKKYVIHRPWVWRHIVGTFQKVPSYIQRVMVYRYNAKSSHEQMPKSAG